MKNLFCLSFFLLLPFLMMAQKYEFGLFVGAGNYQGDLVLNSLVPEETLPAAGLMLRYRIDEKINVRSGLFAGKLSGNDQNFSERRARGYAFETNIVELSAGIEWVILGKKRYNDQAEFVKNFSPYLFAGAGVAFFNPTVTGLPNNSPDLTADFSKTTLVLPFGAGLRFDLNERIAIGAEIGLRAALNDYIDGVSLAGDKNNNDWYEFLGASFTYFLGESSINNQ
jgi:hypothetical protein